MTNAHHAILDFAERHKLSDTPRTTCVACLVQDNVAYWAHAGDSRLFLMRGGKVVAQTRDHSRIRILIEEGLLSEARAATHPDRNKIYSCLGSPTPAGNRIFAQDAAQPRRHPAAVHRRSVGRNSRRHHGPGAQGQQHLSIPCRCCSHRRKPRAAPHVDNLSVVAVRWEETYLDEASSSISTQTMALDEIATHIEEFGRDPAHKTELSEDEIEQAIEEIRSTIDKFNPKQQGQ